MKILWSNSPTQAKIVTEYASCLCTMYNNGKANVMIIDDVFVDENHRREGHGQKILEEAIKFAKKNSVDSIELQVNTDNSPAVKLYENNSFEKTDKYYYRLILRPWTT